MTFRHRLTHLFLLLLGTCFLLTACRYQQSPSDHLRVGVIAGPEQALMEQAKQVAKNKYHLIIDIVSFNDYATPNRALESQDIDANIFQHLPYLQAMQQSGFGQDLVVVARTFVFPMSVYSNRYHDIQNIPQQAKVLLPNDPANLTRSLRLLANSGLITVAKKPMTAWVGIDDITKNHLRLQFHLMDAALLPRALNDADLAVVNLNYAYSGHLSEKTVLWQESNHSPYANLIVTRSALSQDPRIVQLINSYHDQSVVNLADKLFHGRALVAWSAKIRH